ncbi:tetratricopeptide repeat protein [Methanobacterium sp.]|uniref:tetratricopeptide repeat protein n=1 Tax=Methanobacterium sp. TaxID=2164 RepID=UPI0025D96FEF|nr:tetratricopeptide repeat protein [Methanobacterium sp.]MDY9923205.1 tetratricopeptide repeat protein [Methanobacterium sp.]
MEDLKLYYLVGVFLILISSFIFVLTYDPVMIIFCLFGIMFFTYGLYCDKQFSTNILVLIVLTLFSMVIFTLIYIFRVMTESSNIIFVLALISVLSIIFIVIFVFNLHIKTAKFQKGMEILNNLRYKEAFEYFEGYVEHYPKDPLAWSGKALVLIKLNKLEESLECSTKAMEIKLGFKYFLVKKSTYSIQIYTKACVLFELEKYEDSLEYIDELLEINPNYSPYLNFEAAILCKLGDYEDALESLNEALRLDPKDPYALSNKGETLRKMGDCSEAMEYIDRALDINPRIPGIWLNKGETLMVMNKNEESLKYIDKALELDPIFKKAIGAKEELSKLIGD